MRQTVVTCDRCGKTINECANPWVHLKKRKNGQPSEMDAWLGDYKKYEWELCPDCTKSLIKWMNEKTK